MKTQTQALPAPKPLNSAPLEHNEPLACQSAEDWEDLTALDPFDLLDLKRGH